MFGSLEDSWIFKSPSAFSLLGYVILDEAYEENLFIHRYVVEKIDIF